MVVMKVSGIVLDPQSKTPILVLRDIEDRRALLIWIGPPEANSIMLFLENIKLSRPATHDLLANTLKTLKAELKSILIHDMKESTLDIIFHIHNQGVGSRYIENLETGDAIYVSEPRGKKLYDPAIKQQLVFGDETSLGLACSFLPFLKQNQQQYRFYFELAEENKDVPGLLGLENCTVFPKHGLFRNEKWINDLPFFKSPDWATAAFALTGNVNSVQAFRKVLKNNTKGKIFSRGYWLEGKKGL